MITQLFLDLLVCLFRLLITLLMSEINLQLYVQAVSLVCFKHRIPLV